MSDQPLNPLFQKIIYFIFRLFFLPVLIWAFLSLPALYYATNYSVLWKVFDKSYINLNFNFVVLIIGVFASIFYFFKKASRIVFTLILISLFLIRFCDIGLKSTFQISFSPIVFRSTSFDSFLIAFNLFGKELVLIILVGLILSIVISFLMEFGFKKSRTSIITLAIFLLLATRSTYILYKEGYYAFEKIPSYLLVKELIEFQDIIKEKHITFNETEVANLREIGIAPQLPDLSKLDTYDQKKNIVILYLESFNSNYTKRGGSNFENLTPNIDSLIENSVFFSNYFNAVTPTHNSMFSSWCGIFPELHDNYVRENPDYTKGLTCFSDILGNLGYSQNFYFGWGAWYGGVTLFLENHNYDRVTELSDIERENPELKKAKHQWGINDTDLSRYVNAQLDQLIKQQPFNIGIFYNDTHPPYFTAPDCPKYTLDNKHLQAIHCVDHAVGIFLKSLKKRGILEQTVVVAVGDTPGHDHDKGQVLYYNKVLLTISSPDLTPEINETFSYTPDLGPTMLEAMGIPVKKINSGHSIFSSRKNFSTLVAPEFTIFNGEYYKGGRCRFEDMEKSFIENSEKITDCERRRIFLHLEQWLNKKDAGRALTMNEKQRYD